MAFPYYPTFPYMQPQQNRGIIWVQGIEAMKSYPVAAGDSVLLMDSETSCFGIKTVDASGMPHPLRVFDYTERKAVTRAAETPISGALPDSEYITRSEFETRIAAILAAKRNTENEVITDE